MFNKRSLEEHMAIAPFEILRRLIKSGNNLNETEKLDCLSTLEEFGKVLESNGIPITGLPHPSLRIVVKWLTAHGIDLDIANNFPGNEYFFILGEILTDSYKYKSATTFPTIINHNYWKRLAIKISGSTDPDLMAAIYCARAWGYSNSSEVARKVEQYLRCDLLYPGKKSPEINANELGFD